ncbi:MAG: MazG nucleotide pyrophosphohydrolase domain-containing protein, partial [Ktedonobacterales bacterium]
KAGKVGFRFGQPGDALRKAQEELAELAEAMQARGASEGEAPTSAEQAELGDTLFALAALAQRLGVRPEDALQQANARFRKRFEAMEALAHSREQTLEALDTAGWLALWAEARAGE